MESTLIPDSYAFTLQRKTDAMGFDRPTVTRGNVMHQSMSFPDLATMKPIRLPRPHVRKESPIYDISTHSDTVSIRRNRALNPNSSLYARSRTLPRVLPKNGPYMFPEHLRTRRLESIPLPDMFNQQSIPEYRNWQNGELMDGTFTRADQLATDRMQPPAVPQAEDRQYRAALYFGENPQLSQKLERPNLPIVETNVRPAAEDDKLSIRARAMAGNPYLGYQRFVFTLNKYPALVMTMVALWNISGRGQEMAKTGTESSYLYHIAMVLEFCAAAVCIVLASINFKNYQGDTSATACKYKSNAPCYSNQERVAYLAALVGCGLMIVLLAISAFVYGGLETITCING
ncbi:hypothetical protein ANCDUO_01370 [Ancylostoma duodenale]|uniref:Uncharacterized protein n=1 Tax=Ancylostoma duodenale TaxID=51022 RepID=A0A0C2HFC8_9BILA|nr:hypothetical protein ANCDUO_01370 [Ancylostoma duodenale]